MRQSDFLRLRSASGTAYASALRSRETWLSPVPKPAKDCSYRGKCSVDADQVLAMGIDQPRQPGRELTPLGRSAGTGRTDRLRISSSRLSKHQFPIRCRCTPKPGGRFLFETEEWSQGDPRCVEAPGHGIDRIRTSWMRSDLLPAGLGLTIYLRRRLCETAAPIARLT